jgi:hypothetical protein
MGVRHSCSRSSTWHWFTSQYTTPRASVGPGDKLGTVRPRCRPEEMVMATKHWTATARALRDVTSIKRTHARCPRTGEAQQTSKAKMEWISLYQGISCLGNSPEASSSLPVRKYHPRTSVAGWMIPHGIAVSCASAHQ